MKIWQRYFFLETVKTLFFFLLCFYGLYVLIDYASHTGSFHHHHSRLDIGELILFYGSEFLKRLEVLLPFAILIATIRVLTRLNTNNELVALMSSGLSLRKLLRPFLFVGFLGVLILFFNTELLLPEALKHSRRIGDKHTLEQARNQEEPKVHHVALEDGSILLFQSFDRTSHRFYDTYWIRTASDIVRIHNLTAFPEPKGTGIEYLKRDPSGVITVARKLEAKDFPDIKFNKARLLETVIPLDELAMSDLRLKLPSRNAPLSEKEAKIQAQFFRKLLLPWLALLAVIGAAPFCVKVTRELNVYFIYAVSIFGLVFIYFLMNGATTLADRQVMDPYIALIVPFAIISSILTARYYGSV